jgi:hypothetical protein
MESKQKPLKDELWQKLHRSVQISLGLHGFLREKRGKQRSGHVLMSSAYNEFCDWIMAVLIDDSKTTKILANSVLDQLKDITCKALLVLDNAGYYFDRGREVIAHYFTRLLMSYEHDSELHKRGSFCLNRYHAIQYAKKLDKVDVSLGAATNYLFGNTQQVVEFYERIYHSKSVQLRNSNELQLIFAVIQSAEDKSVSEIEELVDKFLRRHVAEWLERGLYDRVLFWMIIREKLKDATLATPLDQILKGAWNYVA